MIYTNSYMQFTDPTLLATTLAVAMLAVVFFLINHHRP
jgi:hypothetical protein